MHYYGTRLSENLSRREPEGYLLCLNVPVARTGTQEYLPEELGLPGGGTLIQVHRPEDEVFSPETIASFEGMAFIACQDKDPFGADLPDALYDLKEFADSLTGRRKAVYEYMLDKLCGSAERPTLQSLADEWGVSAGMIRKDQQTIILMIREKLGKYYGQV